MLLETRKKQYEKRKCQATSGDNLLDNIFSFIYLDLNFKIKRGKKT